MGLQVYEVSLPYDYLIKTLNRPGRQGSFVGRKAEKTAKIRFFRFMFKVLVR